MSAVMEATRAQEHIYSTHEAALNALRHDKEHTAATFAAQLQAAQDARAAEVKRLEKALEETKEALAASNARFATLKEDSNEMQQNFAEDLCKLQKSRDDAIYDLARKGMHMLLTIQRRDKDCVELEETLLRQRLCWSETGARYQLAANATLERHNGTVKRLKAQIWERDKQAAEVESKRVAAEHDLSSRASAYETEKGLLQQRIQLLDNGMEEERRRNESLTSQLSSAKDAIRTISAMADDSNTQHKNEIQRFQQSLDSARRENEGLANQNKTLTAEIERLANQITRLESERSELSTKVITFQTSTQQQESTQAETIRTLKADLAKERQEYQMENDALRRELQQCINEKQRESEKIRQVTDEVILEKDNHIESLKEQLRHREGEVTSVTEANEGLAKRISAIRDQHNSANERLISVSDELSRVTEERDAARNAERAARQAYTEASTQLQAVKTKADSLASSMSQIQSIAKKKEEEVVQLRNNAQDTVKLRRELAAAEAELKTLREKLADKENGATESVDAVGQLKALTQKLSLRTQEVAELKAENKRLYEEYLLADCKYSTAETRLHHSLQEGANTSLLLDRGLRRVQESTVAAQESRETKNVLLRCARALRQALEDEGYSMSTLPLAPTESLDMSYLHEVLLDHVNLAVQHLRKASAAGVTAGSSAVPSALRTPMVYRQPQSQGHQQSSFLH